MSFIKTMAIATLLTIIVLVGAHQPAAAQGDVPHFEPEPCETFEVFQDAPTAVEGTDVNCGYLIVPEQRTEPTDKTINLGIVIIESTSATPAEPLVMAQGGTIDKVTVNVSGEHVLDMEMEALEMLVRE